MALELTQEQKDAGWLSGTLEEFLTLIIDHRGKTPKKLGGDWSESGHRVISAINMKNSRVDGNDHHYVDDEIFAKWMKIPVAVGDVFLTSEAPMGAVAYISDHEATDWVVGQRIFALRADEKQLHGRYLYYLLQTNNMKEQLESRSSGTTVMGIKQAELRKVELILQPVEEQKRIAEILGSLDDKIEANSRLIQNLEELADLAFDSHLEDLSEVLEDTTYGSLNFFGGGTPNTKTPDYWDGEVNWVTPTDVTSLKSHTLFESSRKITEAGLAACSSKLHPAGSIMMTSRATIGRFAVNQVPAATNQGFIVVQPANEYERWWIYHSMKKDVELFLLLANGATFLELSRRVFKDIPLKMFHGKTELPAIHNQIIALEAENKSLGETRNLLIRHLIG